MQAIRDEARCFSNEFEGCRGFSSSIRAEVVEVCVFRAKASRASGMQGTDRLRDAQPWADQQKHSELRAELDPEPRKHETLKPKL